MKLKDLLENDFKNFNPNPTVKEILTIDTFHNIAKIKKYASTKGYIDTKEIVFHLEKDDDLGHDIIISGRAFHDKELRKMAHEFEFID